MPSKIFINYRREDARDMAARIHDRLTGTFGSKGVFMDVDNLMAGQRFDRELDNALAATDVFLAVIGPKWMELFSERLASGRRDYVREEIAGALKRSITVIPVLVEQTPLPDENAIPSDIRELLLHQKHVVTHEQFGRDVLGLSDAIRFARTKPVGQPEDKSRALGFPAIVALGLIPVILGVGYAINNYDKLRPAPDKKHSAGTSTSKVPTDEKAAGAPLATSDCKKGIDATKAITACTDVLSRFTNSTEAYLVRGEANQRLSQHRDAIADYTKVIDMEGVSVETLLEALGGRAEAYLRNGAPSEAARDNQRIFELLRPKRNR